MRPAHHKAALGDLFRKRLPMIERRPRAIEQALDARFLIAPRRSVSGLRAADRTELPHVPLVRLNHVGIEIQFAIQPGMHAGQVIVLQVVVHISLPVALHVVGAALEQLHLCKRKLLRLCR